VIAEMRCPVTGKVQYANPKVARNVADAAFGRKDFRVYRCEHCRLWHLTTKRVRAAA
jgi:hypothetical protein